MGHFPFVHLFFADIVQPPHVQGIKARPEGVPRTIFPFSHWLDFYAALQHTYSVSPFSAKKMGLARAHQRGLFLYAGDEGAVTW